MSQKDMRNWLTIGIYNKYWNKPHSGNNGTSVGTKKIIW